MESLALEIKKIILGYLHLDDQLSLTKALGNPALKPPVRELRRFPEVNTCGSAKTPCFRVARSHYYNIDHDSKARQWCQCEWRPICDCGELTKQVDMTRGTRSVLYSSETPLYDIYLCSSCNTWWVSCRGCSFEVSPEKSLGKVRKIGRPQEGPIFEPPYYENHKQFCVANHCV